jgi:hypothetical protein
MKDLPIGATDFAYIRQNGDYYATRPNFCIGWLGALPAFPLQAQPFRQ